MAVGEKYQTTLIFVLQLFLFVVYFCVFYLLILVTQTEGFFSIGGINNHYHHYKLNEKNCP